jgi:hypothetical protein
LVGSGCSPILVDHSAEDSMVTDRGVERNHGGRVVDWRVLVQALMRAMVIEVTHVLVEDGAGVSFLVEQQPVGALLANTADESLGIAVRPRGPGRDLDDVDAFRGARPISRSQAAWVVQAAVGWAVTPSRCNRRVRISMVR